MNQIKKHDIHIHTNLSFCSEDPTATLENYVARAKELGLAVIGISDHMWDSENITLKNPWYQKQTYDRQLAIREGVPKEIDGVRILWGCETDYDREGRVGITKERAALLDFVLVPHSHFHMRGFTIPEGVEAVEEVAAYAVKTFKEVASLDVTTGIAHPFDTCRYGNDDEKFKAFFDAISDEAFRECFAVAKQNNVSVEINISSFTRGVDHPLYEDTFYRMFRLAKDEGCKFHFGSDTHSIKCLERVDDEPFIIQKLGLSQADILELI